MSDTQPSTNSIDSPIPRMVTVAIVWTAVLGFIMFVGSIVLIVRDLSSPDGWFPGFVAHWTMVLLLIPEILTLLVTALLFTRQRSARILHTAVCCLWVGPLAVLLFVIMSAEGPVVIPVLVGVVVVILLPAVLTWLPASRGYFSRRDKTPIITAMGLTWVFMCVAAYLGGTVAIPGLLGGDWDEASRQVATETGIGLLLIPAVLTSVVTRGLLTGKRWTRVIHTALWVYWAGVVFLVLPRYSLYAEWSMAIPGLGLTLMAVAVLLTWLPMSRPLFTTQSHSTTLGLR